MNWVMIAASTVGVVASIGAVIVAYIAARKVDRNPAPRDLDKEWAEIRRLRRELNIQIARAKEEQELLKSERNGPDASTH